MIGRSMRAGLWIMLIILRAATTADAQSEDDLSGLDQTTLQLLQMSKQPGAIAMATRDLAAAERQFGPDAPNVGQSLDNLARLYQSSMGHRFRSKRKHPGQLQRRPAYTVMGC